MKIAERASRLGIETDDTDTTQAVTVTDESGDATTTDSAFETTSTATHETILVRVIDGWYETVDQGYQRSMPVLHYHGRDSNGQYRHWAVDQYRPYLLVPQRVENDILHNLSTDSRVLRITPADRPLMDPSGYGTDGPTLLAVRVVVEQPWHVRQLREILHEDGVVTGEADILFAQRHLVDQGVKDLVRVPTDLSQTGTELSTTSVASLPTVTEDALTSVDHDDCGSDTPVPSPRIVTWDIEVYNEGEFPEPKAAQRRVTAVAAHDNYTDRYIVFALRSETVDWPDTSTLLESCHDHTGIAESRLDIRLYDAERQLLVDLVRWLQVVRPGVITGWNNDSFDAPYIINRCHEHDVDIERLSPTRSIDRHENGGRFINSDVCGIHIFDLLDAYKKSTYTELSSNRLEDVAAAETERETLSVDEQAAWRNDPTTFVAYNLRDTHATVAINRAKSLLH